MPPQKSRKEEKARLKQKMTKTELRRQMLRQFLPLLYAIGAWGIVMLILHLPAIQYDIVAFFVQFTIKSAVLFGQIFFIPIESQDFPLLRVDGYQMAVIMECTAYNFYIFTIFLSLFSPVSWKQRLITLAIFLPSIFVINNLRFVTMGYIGKHYPEQFDQVHDYVWNILFGILVFLIWLWRYQRNLPGDGQSPQRSATAEMKNPQDDLNINPQP
ncbi:MAG: exosortase/archaeosortase family protein [Bacteroidales bacterium]|nr:exosortase/archaeosortase family protein [Lentimicrobiaceae bacterium]MDD5694696.1 exosortase/archaeosortase family protein [Bacteroidales bacterium]